MVKVFRTKRVFSDAEKYNVIFSTYKSFTDFTHRRALYSEVGKQLGIKEKSVRALVERFKLKYKYDIDKFITGTKIPGRPIRAIGSVEIEQELLNQTCL